MTTARDVIAEWLTDGGFVSPHQAQSFADSLMAKLEMSPESVRLELAAKLNPWRPIETAPKDKRLLLWWRTCREPSVGQWCCDGDREGWASDDDECVPRNQKDCTHYQLLPAPPSEDKP